MSPKKDTQKSAKSTTAINKKSNGFTDEERAAMKERAQELKADARRGPRGKKERPEGEADCLARTPACRSRIPARPKRLMGPIKPTRPAARPETGSGMP